KEAFNKSEGNDKATEDLGVRVVIQQIENLSKEGIDNFHLYTLNRSEMTKRIIQHFAVPSMDEIARSEIRAS
ncbi:MAG: methylenetetrahydrofolate reductase, partial [Chloroflexota bacterium]|nr:methylenetetrahydrofolate reductase [Chloroflexota bacterium]